MTLMDGGNTLFHYCNSVDYELYSSVDRPDVMKVPFRGGLCKVSPQNLYGNRHITSSAGNCSGPFSLEPLNDATASGRRLKPFWNTSMAVGGTKALGIGYQGSDTPDTSANLFPADSLCNSTALNFGGKMFQPCHSTE